MAALVLALAAFTACSDDKPSAATATTVRTTLTTFAPPDVKRYEDGGDYVNGLHMARVVSFDEEYIGFDVVQFLTGDAAQEAFKADHDEGELDADYYIRNQSKQVRTLPLANDVAFRVNITGGYEPTQPYDGHEVNASTFDSYNKAGKVAVSYFWLTIRDSQVSKVEEQFIP